MLRLLEQLQHDCLEEVWGMHPVVLPSKKMLNVPTFTKFNIVDIYIYSMRMYVQYVCIIYYATICVFNITIYYNTYIYIYTQIYIHIPRVSNSGNLIHTNKMYRDKP